MTADAVREALDNIGANLHSATTYSFADVDAIRQYIAALDAEIARLYELAGYGGVSADAPERIILASSMYDGLECCDKWCSVDRVVDDGQPMPESATVYIRADLAHAPAKAREVTEADVEQAYQAWRTAVNGEYTPNREAIRAALATFAEGAE